MSPRRPLARWADGWPGTDDPAAAQVLAQVLAARANAAKTHSSGIGEAQSRKYLAGSRPTGRSGSQGAVDP